MSAFPKKKDRFGSIAVKSAQGDASKLEKQVREWLELREHNGEISELQRQQSLVLQDGPQYRRVTWRIDFTFQKDGELWGAEAKGFETDVYILKRKWFIGNLSDKLPKKIEIWKASKNGPILTDTIERELA